MTKEDAENITYALNYISLALECILEQLDKCKSSSFISEYIDEIDKIADSIEEKYCY